MEKQARNVKAVFDRVLEIETAAGRQAYLDGVCAEAPELRQKVEALLQAYEDAGSFLEKPAASLDTTGDSLPGQLADKEGLGPSNGKAPGLRSISETPGTVIGPYKLLQQIGEGGMGAVFLAEQQHPVRRKVALKVIKAGMDTRQVIARFEAERQALAMMDHINIARVLDVGATDTGRPFFVMELVHGVPITQYCDDNRLAPRERLELFVPVCQAIQHAHQKGIIHRDIKPSNVMVTLYDGKPVPKVIDFGVAKATEQKLTERTLFTQYGTLVGTLEYMSPEQAEMSALGVDTRSDIFSLGVLLYELLTGSTPLTHKRLKEAAYAEILRMIKEEEPPKPSTRLSDSGEALASISAQRHMEPAKLTKLMRGELDWIVMKTLEKDRNRRYETASGFAADVQHYLDDEPVLACPPSGLYRLRKLTRRYKVALGTAVVVVAALLAGTAVSVWQGLEANAARQLANEKHRLAEANFNKSLEVVDRFLFRVANNKLDDVPLLEGVRRDILEDALSFYRDLLGENESNPKVRKKLADVCLHVALVYDHFSEGDKSSPAYFEARAIFENLREQYPDDAHYTADLAFADITIAYATSLAISQAEREHYFRDCIGLLEPLIAQRPDIDWREMRSWFPDVGLQGMLALAYEGLGESLNAQDRLQEAEKAFRKSLELGQDDPIICANVYGKYATFLIKMDRNEEALALVKRAIQMREANLIRSPQSSHDQGANAGEWGQLGDLLVRLRRPAEAEHAYRKAVDRSRKLVADYPTVPMYKELRNSKRLDLVRYYMEAGRPEDAERFVGEMEARTAQDYVERGFAYAFGLRQFDKAKVDYSKAIELDPANSRAWKGRGVCYSNLSQSDKAIADYSKAIELDPTNSRVRYDRGRIHARLGQWDKAVADFSKAVELKPSEATYWLDRANAHLNVQQYDRAIADLTKAIQLKPNYAEAWNDRGAAQAGLKQIAKAIADYSEAIKLKPDFALALHNRASLYAAQGQWDKASADFAKVVALVPTNAVEHNNLAWFLVTCPDPKFRDPSKAVKLAQKAVELAPKEGNHWNTLGVAHYRAGDWKAATAALEKSDELLKGKELSFNAFFLAMAHWQSGSKDEARKWYDRAMEWMAKNDPNNEELGRFRAEAEQVLKVTK